MAEDQQFKSLKVLAYVIQDWFVFKTKIRDLQFKDFFEMFRKNVVKFNIFFLRISGKLLWPFHVIFLERTRQVARQETNSFCKT